MEILNNIWTVLTTPNEFNMQLIVMPFSFIEVYINASIFLLILNISASRKSKILYIILESIISIIGDFFIPSPFNVFINYISFLILSITIFKSTPFKALISLVVSVAIFRNYFYISSTYLSHNFPDNCRKLE